VRLAVFFLSLSMLACGNPPTPTDGGTGGDAGTSCLEPDRVCPADPPLPGSPCEGMLVCPYAPSGMATCAGGTWLFDSGCDGGPIGGSCIPPLAEVCRTPFTGTLTGASIEVGPADGVFRPFADHEPVTADFGGQGGAMVAYRVRVEGTDVAPECVSVSTTVTYDGMAPVASRRGIRLHCGQSLGMLDILSDRPCESRIYPVTMTVEVQGVGSTTATLDLMGGLCPRTF
jgi:hypothetical protein